MSVFVPSMSPKQTEVFNAYSRCILVNGPRRSGKCRNPDAVLYTADGLARMGTLMPDHIDAEGFGNINLPVTSWDGSKLVTATANKFYLKPDGQAIKGVLENGYDLIGSPQHPVWCCWEENKETKFGYKTLTEIGELLSLGKRAWTPFLGHPNYTTTKIQTVCGINITESIAYLLGALCGDGSCNKIEENRSVRFTNIDKECLDLVQAATEELGGRMVEVKSTKGKGQSFNLVESLRLRTLVLATGLNKLSYFKRIPACVVASPKPILCAFLRALFDTDGTCAGMPCVSLTTTSPQLATDIQEVMAALNILVCKRPRKSASGKPTWTLSIYGKFIERYAANVGFSILRKQNAIPKIPTAGYKTSRFLYPKTICHDIKIVRANFLGKPYKAWKPYTFTKKVRTWQFNGWLPWVPGYHYQSVKSENEAVALVAQFNAQRTEFLKNKYHSRAWHDEHRYLSSNSKYIPGPEKLKKINSLLGSPELLRPYLISDTWLEIKSIESCESDLVDICVPETHSFLASGLINHNTHAVLHRIVRHLWEVPRARLLIMTKNFGALESGSWNVLIEDVFNEWQQGLGEENFHWVTPPRRSATTHRPLFGIRNMYGSESICETQSLDWEGNAATTLKGRVYSCCWLNEIANWDSPDVLNHSLQTLRTMGLPFDHQFVIADCNPEYHPQYDEPEAGRNLHWLFDRFYQQTGISEAVRAQQQLIEFTLKDNPWLKQSEYDELEAMYSRDPMLKAQMLEGRWTRAHSKGMLANIWTGPDATVGDGVETIAAPQEDTTHLYTSWDMGDRNTAIVAAEYVDVEAKMRFTFLDELIILGRLHGKQELVTKMLDKMAGIEAQAREENGRTLTWTHFSDIQRYMSGTEMNDYDMVYELSDGAIKLKSVKIGAGKSNDIARRISLVKQLVMENRILVSGKCRGILDMLNNVVEGKDGKVPLGDPMRHCFDAVSYLCEQVLGVKSRVGPRYRRPIGAPKRAMGGVICARRMLR